jgi:XTP/dITP diphosphohydrolase
MKETRVLLGTTNAAKQRKLRWLLEGLPLKPVTPSELGLAGEGPEEQGVSHRENAVIKAKGWSRTASMMAVASDGGLLVPALGDGWESLLTHRFAGSQADDTARLARLLELMRPHRGDGRRASWVEALAISREGRKLASWEVRGATGVLLEEPRQVPAAPGFWVFPAWYFPHLGKTYPELDEAELESVDDHWTRLKSLVGNFFKERGRLD